MDLLQIKIDSALKKAIQDKAEVYGVPASSLVRIVLVKAFLHTAPGNVFNADRDTNGKAVPLDDLLAML